MSDYVLVPRGLLDICRGVIGEIDLSQAVWYADDARLALAQLRIALERPDDLLKAMEECARVVEATAKFHDTYARDPCGCDSCNAA